MIKAMIVDDLPLAVASLKAEIEDNYSNDVVVIETAFGVRDAFKKLKECQPDLIFLDIHMDDGDGFQLLDIINREDLEIVFTTASRDHAIKAFQYSASDYLLKPVTSKALKKSIEALKAKINNRSGNQTQRKKQLALRMQDEIILVDYNQIVRLEASGNYTKFYLLGAKDMLVSKTLKTFSEILPEEFIRVHQSHLVNRFFVKKMDNKDGTFITMVNGDRVPVATRKKAEVSSILTGDNKESR